MVSHFASILYIFAVQPWPSIYSFFCSRHIDPWLNICFRHYSSLLQYFSDSLLRHWDLQHSSSGSYSILNKISSSSNYNCSSFSSGLTAKFYPLPGKLINNTIYVIKSRPCVLLLGSLAILTVHYGRRNMEPVVTETTSISEYMQKSSHLSRHFPGTAWINSSIPRKMIRWWLRKFLSILNI